MKLEITYTDGRATKVMLDGRQMDCCSMLDIHMEPGSLPVATLHVPVTELDINLLDYIIISPYEGSYFSFADEGLM